MADATIVLFAKEPKPGRVKTRLAAAIGEASAVSCYCVMLTTIMARLRDCKIWRTIVAVTPDEGIAHPLFQGAGLQLASQGPGDLGARITRFLSQAQSGRPVVVVGSDVPGLTVEHVAGAVRALEMHDLAIGPSPDGGYWLIGARRPPHADLFRAVRWSTRYALADTLANAGGLSVAMLDILEDVDDLESYRRHFTCEGSAAMGSNHPLQEAPPRTQNFEQCG